MCWRKGQRGKNLHHYTFILQLELIGFSQCSDNYGVLTAGEESRFICKSAQKTPTKQCRSFASITTGALKWSIIYYLTKPNGSNNNKGNEADVQDLPFLSTSCRAGAAATNPQPSARYCTNTCSRRTLPRAPLCSCILCFYSTSGDNVSATEWHPRTLSQ